MMITGRQRGAIPMGEADWIDFDLTQQTGGRSEEARQPSRSISAFGPRPGSS